MPQQPAILHLTLSFAPGGRRTAIQTLTSSSDKLCKHYLVVLNEFEAGPNEIDPYFTDSLELKKTGLIDLTALASLKDFCRKYAIVLIHAHDAASQLMGALIKLQMPGIKLIMTFHRSLPFESAGLKNKMRNALCCLMSEKILCASQERRRHFIAENYVAAAKVMVIPLGVNIENFKPTAVPRLRLRKELNISDSTFVVGSVGHFGEEKGLDCVIESFTELLERNSGIDSELLIIGRGDQARTDYLRQLAEKAGAKIRFLGFRNDISDLMQAMDCFLHMPRMEAFGLVLIEAMASGLPVIANEVGGIPDIVVPDKTGFLIQNNSQDQVVMALGQLYADQQVSKTFGEAGRARALAEFSANQFGLRSVQLYQTVLGN